ncbi:MAG: hypothetical protein ACC612_00700 [Methanomethylovorans sp.]|uniref:hypothetical protein n=1 Tax=Methanomethylovorans sp. TaxID=2758717 RepID=UPI003530F855
MNIKFIKCPEVYLILISFTFLAMWILGTISLALGSLVHNSLVALETSRQIYLLLLYIFSMLFPAIGIILFTYTVKKSSARWYWGIPLFIAVFLITFLRDNIYMVQFYNISFISAYDKLHVLDSQTGKAFISIFFALSSLLFTLSVPENRRKTMVMPLRMAILASASIIIYNIVDLSSKIYVSEAQIFGILHVLGVFLFGLSLVRVAINYDK